MKITLNKQSKKYFGNVSVRNDCLLSLKIFFWNARTHPISFYPSSFYQDRMSRICFHHLHKQIIIYNDTCNIRVTRGVASLEMKCTQNTARGRN